MNTQVVVLAAVTVLLHVPAGRGFSVKSRDGEHQLDAGDGTGMKGVSGESDVSNQDLDAGNLMLVKESLGNELHDIRRREASSRKRSRKRHGESGDGSGGDQKHESNEKGFAQEISDFLKPKKEMIINFMKPILDRIKHKPKKPSPEGSSDPPPPPSSNSSDFDVTTPADYDVSTSSDSDAPSSSDSDATSFSDSDGTSFSDSDGTSSSDSDGTNSSDSDATSSSDSDGTNSSDSDATSFSDSVPSNSTNSDISTPSDSLSNIFPLFPFSFSKCGTKERHRNTNTLSLLFPEVQSNKSEQPLVFVPLTNALMRVVEQQIIGESQSGKYSRRKLHN